jgi:hypothetical protein
MASCISCVYTLSPDFVPQFARPALLVFVASSVLDASSDSFVLLVLYGTCSGAMAHLQLKVHGF